ncbi:GldG family protein [Sandaracinus amylolyticus]|uniref:Mucin 2 n=1 Tax=Sandaracinus amylolyticus TaxID=927083 RepID=A0A0F6SF68_9BACT|nr:GldG family protein [Sandaracinus amylolyticus]AKF06419.1 Mucin 2 precursor [Sandaracinus amylolyticus]
MTSDKTRTPEPKETAEKSARDDAASKRRFEGRTNVVVASLLVLAIALMGNYLSFRHYQRWDWTSEGVFTLSDRTRAVLRELDHDVDAWLVLSSAEPNYQDLRELLQRYRAESQRITLHFVDPDREPGEYRVLAERLRLGHADLGGGVLGSDVAVVLESGDRQWKIGRDDLVSVDFDALEAGEARVDVRSEQALTGGLLEVTAGRPTKVCVTQGHGEWTLGRGAERDLGALQDQMRRDNLDIQPFETRGAQRVPEDCDALFVVGPTTAFTSAEAELIRGYVQSGGNLFVAADPELRDEQITATGLEEVLRDFGIRIDRSLVLELDPRFLPQSATSPIGPYLVASWGDHPITRPFRDPPAGVLFQIARSVRPVDPDRATTLLSTSESSFAETELAQMIQRGEPSRDDADLAGPVSIAVATRVERLGEAPEGETEDAAEDREGGRVVVVGDADFLDSQYLGLQEVMNYELASAIVGWLTEREALIELPGRSVEARPVRMSQEDVDGLGFRVVVLLPAAIFFLGFAVWWNRRS